MVMDVAQDGERSRVRPTRVDEHRHIAEKFVLRLLDEKVDVLARKGESSAFSSSAGGPLDPLNPPLDSCTLTGTSRLICAPNRGHHDHQES